VGRVGNARTPQSKRICGRGTEVIGIRRVETYKQSEMRGGTTMSREEIKVYCTEYPEEGCTIITKAEYDTDPEAYTIVN
jgi:hypothetical protein